MINNLTVFQTKAIEYIESINLGNQVVNNLNVDIVRIESNEKILKVEKLENNFQITISDDHLIYRGLYILLPRLIDENVNKIKETASINEVAYSLDASRNGIMTIKTLKKFIAYLSIMGFNSIHLYTEDTYEVENLPYFGYMRGRYTEAEIKEIVSFASLFKIEVIPSIQTLAHLSQFLKWPDTMAFRDDAHTLLIGDERTYDAIEKMIISCKKMYNSKKIHLGMDEAYQAGLGRYLELYGYTDRAKLMIEHINRVLEIVKENDLEPIIWSDFIYKLLDTTNSSWLYNKKAIIDKELANQLPKNLKYAHWDYGCEDVSQYETVIKKHLEFCDINNYIFAGGAHIWGRIAPNHGKSLNTIKASLKACNNLKVSSVLLTTWGDDGQETEHWHSLISAIYYTECIYSNGNFNIVKNLFDSLFGVNTYDMMYELRKFDEIPTIPKDNPNMTNISKSLLWQDILTGIYDEHVDLFKRTTNLSVNNIYSDLSLKIKNIEINPNEVIINLIKDKYITISKILSIKSELGLNLIEARKNEDVEKLMSISQTDINNLIILFDELKEIHYQVWSQTYKSYGWEVLEQRYAHSISRLVTTQRRIKDYANGNDELSELIEKRELFTKCSNPMEFNGFSYKETAFTGYN